MKDTRQRNERSSTKPARDAALAARRSAVVAMVAAAGEKGIRGEDVIDALSPRHGGRNAVQLALQWLKSHGEIVAHERTTRSFRYTAAPVDSRIRGALTNGPMSARRLAETLSNGSRWISEADVVACLITMPDVEETADEQSPIDGGVDVLWSLTVAQAPARAA